MMCGVLNSAEKHSVQMCRWDVSRPPASSPSRVQAAHSRSSRCVRPSNVRPSGAPASPPGAPGRCAGPAPRPSAVSGGPAPSCGAGPRASRAGTPAERRPPAGAMWNHGRPRPCGRPPAAGGSRKSSSGCSSAPGLRSLRAEGLRGMRQDSSWSRPPAPCPPPRLGLPSTRAGPLP